MGSICSPDPSVQGGSESYPDGVRDKEPAGHGAVSSRRDDEAQDQAEEHRYIDERETRPVQPEEQPRPQSVGDELQAPELQRRPDSTCFTPHEPARGGDAEVEDRLDGSEDPVRRVPIGLL